uniref:Chlorophyll a-b binding protein, chloroplastic n=1 Tax=Picea sitchensis TaxID=3332 RepID=A9NLZ0_PICSI|nr:unknown [Picea sitchensis]
MASATAASSLASASSSFFAGGQQLKAEKNVSRIYARFSFSGLKKKTKAVAKPKPKPKPKPRAPTGRPLWLPGAKAPEWLDGSLVGDYGFDPLGLGKPSEYLQYEIKKDRLKLAEIKHARLAMVAFLIFAIQAAVTSKGPLTLFVEFLGKK